MESSRRTKLLSIVCLSILLSLALVGCQESSPLIVYSITGANVSVCKAGTADWIEAEIGMSLEQGDIIRSGNSSNAEITCIDGSTVELQAGTEIQVASLAASDTGSATIVLNQIIGSIIFRVIKIIDPGSRYEVLVPGGAVVARGSAMQVTVTEDGTTQACNLEGDIWAIAQGVELQIPQGRCCIITPGQPPELTWYVDDDLADYPAADFTRIQDAVDAASLGDRIVVYPGTYAENVNVDKDHLTIQSENGAATTIVETANATSPVQVFAVWADYVTISGFTVRKARYDISSIAVGSSYCCIENNDAQGIFLGGAMYNIVRKNRSSNSWAGIYQENSGSNTLYLNDLTGNGANVVNIGSSNGTWHSPEEIAYTYNGNTYTGYLGNYWSDYSGSDANADGIGDTPRQIGTEADNYPLMEPFENYGIGLVGKIAFVHDVYPGNSEIYVMNADGTSQIQLTDSPQNDYHPAWSPDGTKIAFSSRRDGNWEIYAMHADGSNQTRLTNNPADDADPTWSPDGTMIAFNSYRDGDWEIYVMTPSGSNQTRLTDNAANDVHPSWSPDGTMIAFNSYRDGNWEIYVMNAGGGGEERVTYDSAFDEEPAWSPDGNRIAFVSDRDGNHEIYVMNADGSNQTRLTTNPSWDYGPTWSPDSTMIAFTSIRDSNREIYAMNADGSGQTRLTENAVSDFSPDW